MEDKKSKQLELSKKYHSGELEFVRRAKISAGAAKWKIIRYQRIIEPEKLPYPISNLKYVTPATFERHLKYLIKNYKIIPLAQLLNSLENNLEIPDKTIVITFDGGWVDNFIYAYPLIVKYQAPVTSFLPTSVIGSEDMYWEDKVMIMLLHLKHVKVTMPIYDFFPANILAAMREASPNLEISLELISLFVIGLNALELKLRLTALFSLSEIFSRLGGGYPSDPTYMNWQEVKTMEQSGILFGSMGHIPNFFSDLEVEAMEVDVKQSFEVLNSKLQKPFPIFAFPECKINTNCELAIKKMIHKFALGGDTVFYDSQKKEFPIILPRVSLFEENSKNFEDLFLTLWNIAND